MTMEFKFIEFNPRRAMRGANAARVEVTDGDGSDWLWMNKTAEQQHKRFPWRLQKWRRLESRDSCEWQTIEPWHFCSTRNCFPRIHTS